MSGRSFHCARCNASGQTASALALLATSWSVLVTVEDAAALALEPFPGGRARGGDVAEAAEVDAAEACRAEHAREALGPEDPPVRGIAGIRLLDEPGVLGAPRIGQELALHEHGLSRDLGDTREEMHRVLQVVHDTGVDGEIERADALVQVLAGADPEIHVDPGDLPHQARLIDPVETPVHAHDLSGASELSHQREEAAVAADIEHGLAAEVGGEPVVIPEGQGTEAVPQAQRLQTVARRIVEPDALQIAARCELHDESRVPRELIRGQAPIEPEAVRLDASRHHATPEIGRASTHEMTSPSAVAREMARPIRSGRER